MSINLTVSKSSGAQELKPRITVIGVGGAGGNAVNNMIKRELGGIEFLTTNTDAQALLQSKAERRIQLGADLTQGLGAGAKPEIGRAAAEEAIDDLLTELENVNMTFIAAGMGGGTGTGAAPVIAKATRDAGILTVGVITKPFEFEGAHRMAIAEEGIQELEKVVDTLIIIPNQNLFRIANESTTFADAFAMADEVLYSGVRGVTDLIVMPGLINLDFADIRSVMNEMGKAMMGTGEAEGERRALDAAEAAINNPLLEDTSMKGAKGVLINITGSDDITLFEVDEAASRIRSEIDSDARIIVGSAFDGELQGRMRVSVVATGIGEQTPGQMQQTTITLTDAKISEDMDLSQPAKQEAKDDVIQSQKEVEHSTFQHPDLKDAEQNIDVTKSSGNADSGSNQLSNGLKLSVEQEVSQDEDCEVENAPREETKIEKAFEKSLSDAPQIGASRSFIPPEPIVSSDDHKDSKPHEIKQSKRDGLIADKEGDSDEESKKPQTSRPSLFELVTRTGKAAIGLSNQSSPEPTVSISSSDIEDEEEIRLDPIVHNEPKETQANDVTPTLEPIIETDIDAETSKSDIGDKTETQDDLLDIPAFLRRQAN